MTHRMDDLASKGMGAVKAVKARVEGLVGVFTTLAKQHGEASAVLTRVKDDATTRRELWPKLRTELKAHEEAETRVVYPALREYAELVAIANDHDAEAKNLSAQIAKIERCDIASDEWGTNFEQLASMVQAHATEEEKDFFPKALSVIGAERARELDKRYLEEHKRVRETV